MFTARDVPGENRFGVIGPFADQPVFAETEARFRGEAVAAVVGESCGDASRSTCRSFPVTWEPLPAPHHDRRPRWRRAPTWSMPTAPATSWCAAGSCAAMSRRRWQTADVVVEGEFETGFVEHAYIEPEAGFARRVGDRIEIQACTQAPYMDRDDVAKILGIAPEAVRIIPTAVGGGFGSKLDLSVQPFIALAAWHLNRPVRMVYSRTRVDA